MFGRIQTFDSTQVFNLHCTGWTDDLSRPSAFIKALIRSRIRIWEAARKWAFKQKRCRSSVEQSKILSSNNERQMSEKVSHYYNARVNQRFQSDFDERYYSTREIPFAKRILCHW